MDKEVYKELIKFCNRLKDVATSRFLDVDIYNDRFYEDKQIKGLLLQLITIEKFKNKIEGLGNIRMITKGMEEGEAE